METRERIRGALAWLDAEDRAAFVLRVVADLPVSEVAAVLEMPAPVVGRRVHRACLLMTGYVQPFVAGAATPSRREPLLVQ
jgi:DNA-directed RNA polymerase specialized sigma24 family protein